MFQQKEGSIQSVSSEGGGAQGIPRQVPRLTWCAVEPDFAKLPFGQIGI